DSALRTGRESLAGGVIHQSPAKLRGMERAARRAARYVPDQDRAILQCAGQVSTVGAVCKGDDRTVNLDRSLAPARFAVPHSHGTLAGTSRLRADFGESDSIARPARRRKTVRAYGQRVD